MRLQSNPKGLLVCMIFFSVFYTVFGGGSAENASLSTRGWYLMDQGAILPAEAIYTDAYLASFNYQYPQPETDMDMYLYNSLNQMSRQGQEGILHIGLQGKRKSFAELPPLNLVFVIDISDSMKDDDKISWVKESLIGFIKKIRAADSLALIGFNDIPQVLFESTRMDNTQKRQQFINAVQDLSPHGGTDIEAGLRSGYEQLSINSQRDSVNAVLLFSDGTDFSARLAQAGASSGDVRISLIWNNRNDLDLHVINPLGEEISFSNRKDSHGGILDVDMNVNGETMQPVENIFWDQNAPRGKYRVYVQNFGYHELRYEPTNFRIEIKNGNERQYFEGRISGLGSRSDTNVCTFEFKGTEEMALIYQMAAHNKQKGFSVSALGVGNGFDRELMQTLAQTGDGSVRSVNSQDIMKALFESDMEFEQIAVKTAQNLEMELEFMPEIEILETWGYDHRIENNRIYYRLPVLHLGEYNTILVRYRLKNARSQTPGNRKQLALLRVKGQDTSGNPLSLKEKSLSIALSEHDPLEGIASGKVLYSGTMMHFAENLKDIGKLYYSNGNDMSRLQTALQKTRETSTELEQARVRLNDINAFAQEQALLFQYDKILTKAIAGQGGAIPVREPLISTAGTARRSRMSIGNREVSRMVFGSAVRSATAPDQEILQNRLASFFGEMNAALPQNEPVTAALLPFVSLDGGEPPLLAYLDNSAKTIFSHNSRLTLVEQNQLNRVLKMQNTGIFNLSSAIQAGRLLGVRYMITGQVIPASTRLMVFSRIIQVETGEILSAPQILLDRNSLIDLL